MKKNFCIKWIFIAVAMIGFALIHSKNTWASDKLLQSNTAKPFTWIYDLNKARKQAFLCKKPLLLVFRCQP